MLCRSFRFNFSSSTQRIFGLFSWRIQDVLYLPHKSAGINRLGQNFAIIRCSGSFFQAYYSTLTGRANLKLEPLPLLSDSTQILPLCNSTNFLARERPKTVPLYRLVRRSSNCTNSPNNLCWSSLEMPIPVSHTVISASKPFIFACMPILPPSGVNLTAFESRLKTICLTLDRKSTRLNSSHSSISYA